MSEVMIWGDVAVMPTGFSWVEITKIALTFSVAGIAALIAYQQSLTAQTKLRLDLFEKRVKIYNEVHKIISSVGIDDLEYGTVSDFSRAILGARWIYNEQVGKYLFGIETDMNRYFQLRYSTSSEPSYLRHSECLRILNFLTAQVGGPDCPLDKKLGPFLLIDQPTIFGRFKSWLRRIFAKNSAGAAS